MAIEVTVNIEWTGPVLSRNQEWLNRVIPEVMSRPASQGRSMKYISECTLAMALKEGLLEFRDLTDYFKRVWYQQNRESCKWKDRTGRRMCIPDVRDGLPNAVWYHTEYLRLIPEGPFILAAYANYRNQETDGTTELVRWARSEWNPSLMRRAGLR